jgi:hypothetical protein
MKHLKLQKFNEASLKEGANTEDEAVFEQPRSSVAVTIEKLSS